MSDLIDRQAAIDVLDVGAELLRRVLDEVDVVGTEREKYEWVLELIESYISDMKDLPPAQPERKRGRWIEARDEDPFYYICSKCGEGHDYTSPFCPGCGSRMDGGQRMNRFPIDCPSACSHLRSWDMSVDDLTYVCDELNVQIDGCDTLNKWLLPMCPLEKEDEG